MAYVNVADWKSDQVADWLKGLDSVILPYIKYFIDADVNGQKLLDMQPNDLDKVSVRKIGHQELILEAVDLLKNFHYELDKENVQLLALRLSCSAHSLYKDIQQNYLNSTQVPTKILIDVANTVATLKPLVNWLNRPPFCGQQHYISMKNKLLKLALEIVTFGQRDRFAENPVKNIFEVAKHLAQLADHIIQESQDSLILQPATLDVATLKKRSGESLGFYIVPSFHGVHQVGEVKCNSLAHQCGKIEAGDEIVQVNYQTVVGWQARQVMALLEEASSDIFLTLKKRPRHSKVFGQIYMKPYRLPSKKLPQFNYTQRYFDQLTPPRQSELLTIPNFSFPHKDPENVSKTSKGQPISNKFLNPSPITRHHSFGRSISPENCSPSNSSSGDESELESANCSSPTSVRLYLPKPHIPVQRRATISGASPIGKHAPFNFDQFWNDLKQDKAHNNSKNNNEKFNSEMQLNKRSKPTKVQWTSLPPNEVINEKLESLRFPDKKLSDTSIKNDVLNNSNLFFKERNNQLKNNNSSDHINKKPKILPKPIIPKVFKPTDNLLPTKVRGKLDKSNSTPSYDFSTDGNLQNDFEYFDSDLRISIEDVNSCNSKKVTNSGVNEEKIKRPDKPILVFPKPPPKNDDDISFTTTPETMVIQCMNKSVKSILHFPKPPPSKTEDLDISKIKDTNVVDSFEFEPPDSGNVEQSTSRVSESSSGFSFDSKNEEHLGNSTNNFLEDKSGIFFGYDNITTNSSQDRVLSIDSPKYSVNHFKNKTYLKKKSQDSPDFEKNSFSDLSDVCPPLSLTDLSGSDDNIFRVDTKDNISLPSERTVIIPHQAVPNAPATFPRQKNEPKKCQPPILPPRPSKPAELPKRTSYRAMLGAKAIGKKENKGQKQSFQRNPLIAKRRNISTKELGTCEYQGWLYQRSKKISPRMQWIKGWFIIKGTTFYGFHNKESTKARLMIILSGFTVSIADEVKSRTNAFKVYHMGTMFYFAAETPDDLFMWLDWLKTATISTITDGHNSNIVAVSETDDEEDENLNHELLDTFTLKPETSHDTSFTSSAFKNISTFLSNHMGSHSNPCTSSNKNKSDKSFHSLKKQQKKNLVKEDQAKGRSLDRKHWKFLGMGMIGRDSSEPVPTSQYRSYRRVPPTVHSNCTSDTSVLPNSYNQNSDVYLIPQISHNRPSDMVDYRLTSITKTDNNQRRTDSTNSSEITLESFMQSRQDERRTQHLYMGMRVPQYTAPPPPLLGIREDQNQQLLDQSSYRIAAESEPRSRQPITALTSVEHNLNVLSPWTSEGSTETSDFNGNRNNNIFPHSHDNLLMPQLSESHEQQLYSNRYCMEQISDNESLEYPPVFEPETYTLTNIVPRRRYRSNNNFEMDHPPGNSNNYRQ